MWTWDKEIWYMKNGRNTCTVEHWADRHWQNCNRCRTGMGQVQQWRKTGTEQVNVVTKTAAAAAAVWGGTCYIKTDSRFFKCQITVIYSTYKVTMTLQACLHSHRFPLLLVSRTFKKMAMSLHKYIINNILVTVWSNRVHEFVWVCISIPSGPTTMMLELALAQSIHFYSSIAGHIQEQGRVSVLIGRKCTQNKGNYRTTHVVHLKLWV